MRNDVDRRRNFLARLSWPALAVSGSAAAVGLAALLGRPITISVGDIDITGVEVLVGAVNMRVLSSDPSGGSSPTVLFHSDWSTCTGMGAEFEDCYIDADKDDPWSAPKGDWETDAAVVDSAFWPDGLVNSLQIWHIGTGSGTGVRIQPNYVIPLYTEGDTIAYRVYFMNVLPGDHDADGTSHASQDGIGGSNTNWEFNITDVSATEWAVSFSLGGAAAGGGFGHREWTLAEDCVTGPACRLDKNEVYRFEWMVVHHPTADSLDIAVRLYDDEGTLIAGEDEWYDQDDGTPSSETVWHAFRDYAQRDQWQVGTNGFGTQGSGGYVTWYWAGAAVCTTWCGAYPIGGVEN